MSVTVMMEGMDGNHTLYIYIYIAFTDGRIN